MRYEPKWHGTTWEAIECSWERHQRRGAIVGPHGSGKTTFFDAFEQRLRDRGESVIRVTLNDQAPRVGDFSDITGSVVLLDSAGWLGFFEWRRFLKIADVARGFIVTQHRTRRVPTILETAATPEMLAAFIEQLCPGFEIDTEALLRRHRGNLREALLECYDLAAKETLA